MVACTSDTAPWPCEATLSGAPKTRGATTPKERNCQTSTSITKRGLRMFVAEGAFQQFVAGAGLGEVVPELHIRQGQLPADLAKHGERVQDAFFSFFFSFNAQLPGQWARRA